jgi:hypothetical protein
MKRRKSFELMYANSLSAYNPAFWANESLAILMENMVIGNLVHRDFSPIVADFGDTVNTRKPGTFTAKRKDVTDDVTVQDSTATNVAVVLNQHVHTSFLIRDVEASKSMKNLIAEFLVPAMQAQARFVDQCLLGQVWQFAKAGNVVGGLGTLSESNVKQRMLALREKLNVNKAPTGNRNLIWTPSGETTALNVDLFLNAASTGDSGQALREASLGRKLSFNNYMCQNASQVSTGNTTKAGAVNNTAGYPIGTTTITVDGFTGAVTTGGWVTFAGDDTPQRITAHTETTGNTTQIVISPGLYVGIADNAVVTAYTPGAVNNASGYAAGWVKEITVDGFTVAPKVGQLVTFGTATDVYSIIQVNGTTGITLDRPLDAAIVDDAVVGIGPPGQANFSFLRNAMGMVIRPLALPPAPTGVNGSVINANNLSMRAVLTYDGNAQGTLVTLDMLWGVKVFDTALGAVLFG